MNLSILLIEDSHIDIELFKEAFKEAAIECQLEVINYGEEALTKLRAGQLRPALIFLDLNLPRMSGLDVLKALKSDPQTKAIPVIILTNSRSENDILMAYSNYCSAYVRKPLRYEHLVAAVIKFREFWLNLTTLPPSSD